MIIEKAAWLLGDAVIAGTNVSVALAIGVEGNPALGSLIEGLRRRQPLDVGLLFAGGCELPEFVGALTDYHEVALREVACIDYGAVYIEQARLGAWISGLMQGRPRPLAGRGGRPSSRAEILSVFEIRRRRGLPYVSKQAEAYAIRTEWLSFRPGERPPGHSTIRNQLPPLQGSNNAS